jgi:hypothetical protein
MRPKKSSAKCSAITPKKSKLNPKLYPKYLNTLSGLALKGQIIVIFSNFISPINIMIYEISAINIGCFFGKFF